MALGSHFRLFLFFLLAALRSLDDVKAFFVLVTDFDLFCFEFTVLENGGSDDFKFDNNEVSCRLEFATLVTEAVTSTSS